MRPSLDQVSAAATYSQRMRWDPFRTQQVTEKAQCGRQAVEEVAEEAAKEAHSPAKEAQTTR